MMSVFVLIIFVLLQTYTFAENSSVFAFPPPSNGIVAVPLTSPYSILCTPSDTLNETANYAVFYRVEKLISNRYVTIFDENTIKLHLHNPLTPTDRFFAKLYFDSNKIELVELNCSNISSTQQPQPVTNFTCTSNNLASLTCSWQEQNDSSVSYSVYYIPDLVNTSTIYFCPKNNSRHQHCTWSLDTTPIYLNNVEYLNFTVQGENKYGITKQTFRIHHHAIVVPAPPRSLTLISRTSSSLFINWRIAQLSTFKPRWFFNITLTSLGKTIYNKIHTVDEVLHGADHCRLNISNLPYANTDYTVHLSIKSTMATDVFWSIPAMLTFRTAPVKPQRAPLTINGGFNTVDVGRNKRYVETHWLPVPKLDQNGNDFYYELTVYEENRIVEVVSITQDKHSCHHVISFKRHKIVIRSANEEGVSQAGSVLWIPAREDLIPAPVSVNVISKNSSKLIWQVPDVNQITDVTIYSCKIVNSSLCEEVSDFSQMSSNQMIFERTTLPQGHALLISINSLTSSSGLVRPTYTIDEDEIGLIKYLKVVKSGSHDMNVMWNSEYPDVASLMGVRGYIIHYCLSEGILCIKTEKKWIIKCATTMNAIIADLNPFSVYRISISTILRDGEGPRSEFVYQRTLESAPSTEGFQFQNKNISSTWIELEWSRPTNMNGVFQYYIVRYDKKKVYVSQNQVRLVDLKSDRNYSIEVYACTSKCSQPIGPQIVRTKGVTGKLESIKSNKLNSTHVSIEWEGFSQIKDNIGYNVRLQIRKSNGTKQVESGSKEWMVAAGEKEIKLSAVISVAAVRGGT